MAGDISVGERKPALASHRSPRLVISSTLFLMVTLSSYDGNIFLLAASGAIFQPAVMAFTGLFSVGGPGAWFAAFSTYSRADRASDRRLQTEFWAIVAVSFPIISAACLVGVLTDMATPIPGFAYAGGLAVIMVGASILVGRNPPSVPLLGGRLPLPTLVVISAAIFELVINARAPHPITGLDGGPGFLLALWHAFSCSLVVWSIGLGSVYLFTLLPAEGLFNKQVLGYFGGVAIILIGFIVAGVPATSSVFSHALAPFGVDVVFCIGLVLSYLVRHNTGVGGWGESRLAIPRSQVEEQASISKRHPSMRPNL